jgi:N-acetylglucosaminyldiphosphoundecaprenol N-acetyl-beta-D-mannosaminyltransferase
MGFERNPTAMRSIRLAVTRARPDIVYSCFGFPKQEQIISELRKSLPSTWFLGLGGSLSIIGGHVSRAPRWLQRMGLEWSWRLAMEPRRLFRRYLLQDAPFALLLLWSALVARSGYG